MIRALRAQTRDVDFVEIGFTGRTDFFVARHPVTDRATLDFISKVNYSKSIVYKEVRASTSVSLRPLLFKK
jgi:hypothetical protein